MLTNKGAQPHNHLHVKKGDTVIVLSGKDKGQKGEIVKAIPKKMKVIVEGINKVKRHTKPSQKYPQGGIITRESPIGVSKVMLVCPACKKPTRIAKKLVNGKYVRACKKCGEVIDESK
ncbi:MAG: 50S ribosomal protein L24 [Schwartzia sp.]|nr:50S ribosomal protein L24 [Schwartzia sp. (in: firmicutes)]